MDWLEKIKIKLNAEIERWKIIIAVSASPTIDSLGWALTSCTQLIYKIDSLLQHIEETNRMLNNQIKILNQRDRDLCVVNLKVLELKEKLEERNGKVQRQLLPQQHGLSQSYLSAKCGECGFEYRAWQGHIIACPKCRSQIAITALIDCVNAATRGMPAESSLRIASEALTRLELQGDNLIVEFETEQKDS